MLNCVTYVDYASAQTWPILSLYLNVVCRMDLRTFHPWVIQFHFSFFIGLFLKVDALWAISFAWPQRLGLESSAQAKSGEGACVKFLWTRKQKNKVFNSVRAVVLLSKGCVWTGSESLAGDQPWHHRQYPPVKGTISWERVVTFLPTPEGRSFFSAISRIRINWCFSQTDTVGV